MVLASFAGAAASATAATHHHNPAVIAPTGSAAVTVTTGALINVPLPATGTTASKGLPAIVIHDPSGLIASNSTVTLTLTGATATRTLTGTPVVTAMGTGVVALNPTLTTTAATATVTFTNNVAPAGATPAATYTVTGLSFVGAAAPGAIAFTVTSTSGIPAGLPADPGAVTRILPAASGANAPDTAAILFRSAKTVASAPTSIVVASDYIPQDAESAAFLAKTHATGVVLTDPTSLSAAVSSIITDYPSIVTAYIVGGTSVVSAGVATSLTTDLSTGRTGGAPGAVIRYSGATQYDTNAQVLNSQTTTAFPAPGIALPYSTTSAPTVYNTSGGASSTTTSTPAGVLTSQTTVIVASGEIGSYQDGIAAGALAYGDTVPVILTTPGALSSTALLEIQRYAPQQVIVLGGPLAVSNAVVDAITGPVASGGLNTPVFRVGGHDATDTAQLLADLEISGTAANGLGFAHNDGGGILLARGNGFQDALAASAYAGGASGIKTPILLTENATDLGVYLRSYLAANGDLGAAGTAFSIQPIGGALSLPTAILNAATNATVSAVTP